MMRVPLAPACAPLLLVTLAVGLAADLVSGLSPHSVPLPPPPPAVLQDSNGHVADMELPDYPYNSTAIQGAADPPGPRRRDPPQWDMAGTALILGGTFAALVLAALGGLASKALLASMLAAALSAVQLARQPAAPARPG